MYCDWHPEKHRKPLTKKQIDTTTPLRVWWVVNPDTLPPTDPSHLCVVCQHIDFKYLLNSPLRQMLETVPLSSLEQIVQKKECAFYRLVTHTVTVAFDEEKLPFEIDGKPVMCELRILAMGTSLTGPRQLLVHLNVFPKGKSVIGSTDHLIYGMTGRQLQDSDTMKGKSISLSRMSHSTIKSWYLTCLNGKCGETCFPTPTDSLPRGFRLVDVQRMCIVEGNNNSRYLALSYVWGGSKTLLNTTDTKIDLQTEAGLLNRLGELPETVKDAIYLVRQLGERHLWVDSLCIIQDDAEDKASQITAMGINYSAAVLTIAATSGNSADAGLAGGQTRLRTFTQLIEKVQGLSLANRPKSFEKQIDQSSWNTRAWTFQERTLSRRVLYVADQRCFFTCQHRPGDFMESLDDTESGLEGSPITTQMNGNSRNLIPNSRGVNILSYYETVAAYTPRQLTYASEILNAFAGVAARLRPLFSSDLLFGIPRSELDSQILWQPQGPMTRRRDPQTGLPICPSWSWSGWVGAVRCNTDANLSRISWVGDDGKTFSSKDCRFPRVANCDPVKRILYHYQWRDALEGGVPYYWKVDNPDQYFFHPTAPEDERMVGPNLRKGTDHIAFEAETTRDFELGIGHYLYIAIYSHGWTSRNHTVCPLPLRDLDGYIAGYVFVPDDVSTTLNVGNHYETITISRTKTVSQEDRGEGNPDLLIDSEATTLEKFHFPDAPDVYTSQNAYGFDEWRFDSKKAWCLYNVMLVEIKEGVAYRVGVGTMHIDAWAQAKPERKMIVLVKCHTGKKLATTTNSRTLSHPLLLWRLSDCKEAREDVMVI